MTWSASFRTPSVSPRAAKNWKVPTRIWLDATRVSTAPGSMVSRCTRSPDVTAASERVVGMPEREHRLADDVFAQHRTERGAAVAPARERRRARALELDVAADAVPVDDLAEQDGAAVAELGHEMAELVAGIGHRDRIGALGDALSGEDFSAFRALQHVGIEPELDGERPVQLDQPGGGDGGRGHAGEKVRRQRRIGVLEREMDGHDPKIGAGTE